MVSDSL
jgi:hypothetical protein